MSAQTDLARLQSELDDPFTPLLLALADWHEENDQSALARAYRRIAAEGKVPDIGVSGWWWLPGSDQSIRYCLTPELMCLVGRHAGGSLRTLSIAYYALALAYAELEAPAPV